jgi:hypothetical protein
MKRTKSKSRVSNRRNLDNGISQGNLRSGRKPLSGSRVTSARKSSSRKATGSMAVGRR